MSSPRLDSESVEGVAGPCCAHHRPSTLGYVAKSEWAEAKIRRGERQSQCPTCKLWFFKEEMGNG